MKTPDVILLDAEMPIMNGLSFAREIRKKPSGKNISIILITSRQDDRIIEFAERVGINYYMTKPVQDRAILYQTIENLLMVKA